MTVEIQSSLPDFDQLPADFAIQLDDFSAISLSGEEKSKYLQGQVTCDVVTMEANQLLNGAHCNAKGKTLSAFRLINHQDSHLLLQAKSSIETSLKELQKFGVFAKVDITETSELKFVAMIGEQAANQLKQKFSQLPDNLNAVISTDNITLVYIAGQLPRYLLLGKIDAIDSILTEFNLPVYSSSVWDLLEIQEGFPVLSSNAIEAYVPQMLNLQAIHGISFTKGCYLGQETVARMQYLGKNKRALFALEGVCSDSAAEHLEVKLGDNWRKAGDILVSYRSDSGKTYLQAVLASDIEANAQLRFKDDESSSLSIVALPYSIN